MQKTLTRLSLLKESLSNELLITDLKYRRNEEKKARTNLGNIGEICGEISDVVQKYLAFGEE